MTLLQEPRRTEEIRRGKTQLAARRLAWLLGFCLPLSGGLTISLWIGGYPDWVTVIRVVTLAILLWLLGTRERSSLPRAPKRLLLAFGLVMVYATASLMWAPSLDHGINNLVSIGLALSTAVAIILLVRGDRLALRAFAGGVLVSGALQVVIALAEVATGRHLSTQFGSAYLLQWNLSSIEDEFGKVAFGTLGNPNDLGGYLLLVSVIFLSRGAYGVVLRRPFALVGWGLLLISVVVGLTSLEDARAYRLGLVIVIFMHLIDRILAPGRSPLRLPVMLLVVWVGIALSFVWGADLLADVRANSSDDLRLTLISYGLGTALATSGFGRGLGAEQALIDSGAIPLNFHNVAVQLAAELGLVVAGAFLVCLVSLVISWAFVTRSAQRMGHEASLARATLAVALLVYGVTSSGVLESPHYWAFFAVTAVMSGVAVAPEIPSSDPPEDVHGIDHPSISRRLA